MPFCNKCYQELLAEDFHIKKNGKLSKTCEVCWNKYYSKDTSLYYCAQCKKIKNSDDDFGIKANGERYKCCINCCIKSNQSHSKNRCEHGRQRYLCVDCDGNGICEHNIQRSNCRLCLNEKGQLFNFTIQRWLSSCRRYDKKKGLFNPNEFIDTDFLRGLIEDNERCYYQDCCIKLQYLTYDNTIGTIERLDNSIGHIKSNVVLACLSCNCKRKSDKLTRSNSF